jgi:hypothetical protein
MVMMNALHNPPALSFLSLRVLWSNSRPLKRFQLCQCPLERDDTSRSQPRYGRVSVAITVRGTTRRRTLRLFSAALLDQRPRIAEYLGEPAVLVVQPIDFGLERAKRNLECTAHKSAREHVRLLIVQPAVDDAFLGPTELVVCRFAEPTVVPPRMELEK